MVDIVALWGRDFWDGLRPQELYMRVEGRAPEKKKTTKRADTSSGVARRSRRYFCYTQLTEVLVVEEG